MTVPPEPAGPAGLAGLAGLVAVFEAAQRLGFLGPGPVADQIGHAISFAEIIEMEGAGPAPFLDLGSGGGLPGLVLAGRWAAVPAVLLDASQRRAAFLRRTVVALGWAERVRVLEGRAEDLARHPDHRSGFPLVVSRSFGPPAVTAEIGGAFLPVGGILAVSEPVVPTDGGSDRWPADGLGALGMGPATILSGTGAQVAMIPRLLAVADRYPRSVGIPAKRPLW